MKEVIERLVEIEKKANDIINNANSEKAEIERKKREDIATLEGRLREENKKKLDKLRIKLDKETCSEIDSIYKEGNKQLQKTESAFYNNQIEMADEVFRRII